MMRISAILLISLLAVAAVATAQTPPPAEAGAPGLSLRDAVDTALEQNPMIHAADAGRSMAKARVWQARSSWLPLVQVTENFVRSDNPVFVFASLLEQGRFGPQHFDPNFLNNPDELDNYRTNLQIRYPVFDQFRRMTMHQQANVGLRQADAQSEQARQQIRYQTIRAYYGVLVAEAGKEVADEAVRTAEAMVKRVRDSFETGLVVQSDLLAGEVQLADFRQQQIDAEGQVLIAREGLNTILGEPEAGDRILTDRLAPRDFTLPDRSVLLEAAMANRPEVRSARLSERASTLQVRQATGQFLPRLDAFATIGASGTDPTTSGSDRMVGAMVTLNVFEPGRAGRLAEARAGRRAASAQAEGTENQVRLEVIQARQNFLSARDRVKVAERAVDQAGEALRIVEDRYQAGLTTITEVLRAQTAAVHARMSLLAARHQYYTGYANALLTTGQLTDVDPFGVQR